MDTTEVLTRISLLCQPPLPSRQVIPDILALLRQRVEATACAFLWLDEEGAPVDGYSEVPRGEEEMAVYASEYFARREGEIFTPLPESADTEVGVHLLDEVLRVSRSTLAKTDYYQRVMKPQGIEDFMRVLLRVGGKAVAGLVVMRDESLPRFTDSDRRGLSEVVPLLESLMKGPGGDETLVESGDAAQLMLSSSGRVLYSTDSAATLVPMLLRQGATVRPAFMDGKAGLPPMFADLLKQAGKQHTRLGRQRVNEYLRNEWGGFLVRMEHLQPAPGRKPMLGVEIQRQLPLRVRVLRRLHNVSLSARQLEVCMGITRQQSYTAIARQLGISRHSVLTHAGHLFHRLGVKTRAGLIDHLMGGAAPSPVNRELT